VLIALSGLVERNVEL